MICFEHDYNPCTMLFRGILLVFALISSAAWGEDLHRIRAAAERGDPGAQYDLGTIYQEGVLVRSDLAEARRLWRKAADQGHSEAQLNLGIAYARGDGVPLDRERSRKWLTLSASQGYGPAQRLLKELDQH